MGMKSQLIIYEQTREVYKFMRDASKQRKEVIQFFSNKWTEDGHFKSSLSDSSKHRTIDNYIRKVKQTFFNFETETDIEKGRVLSRLDDLYSKSLKIQDYKGALSVLKEINEMLGLKAPIKVKNEHSGEIKQTETDISKLSVEDQVTFGKLRLKAKGIDD